METIKDKQLINEILTRSVDSIYPSKEALKNMLLSGRQLRIYMGIDPTAPHVHLGHSTNYLILGRLHKLGHKIIVLVGDFTAMIGDPSDKSSARAQLKRTDIEANLKTFKDQISQILDFSDKNNAIEFDFNSKWLSKLSFEDAVDLASNFTVQQMIERDTFQKRLKEGKPLHVHEFFYPLMQGYDSVALDVDLEIGGTDQTFNMLAGRTLLKRYKDKEKCVMTTTLLVNPRTGEKLMSKSLGTGIWLDDAPNEMFGKVMALPDEGIIQCFIDCTRLSMDEVLEIEKQLKAGVNPRDVKIKLAKELVTMYHSKVDAEQAERYFYNQFQSKDVSKLEYQEIELSSLGLGSSNVNLAELLVALGARSSKGEAKRLIEQGGVTVGGEKILDPHYILKNFSPPLLIRAGTRGFYKVI